MGMAFKTRTRTRTYPSRLPAQVCIPLSFTSDRDMLGVGLWGRQQCGGHTECLRDGICPELPDGDMLSESEKVVKKGVPLQLHTSCSLGLLVSHVTGSSVQ